MKNKMKKLLILTLVFTLIFPFISPSTNVVNAADKITMHDFTIRLVKALKLEVKKNTNDGYINAAIESGLLKESEKSKLTKNITNQYVAELTNRADKIQMGDTYSYNETLYYQILGNKRISDISKSSKSFKDSIYIMFSKGIMPGYYNGKYSQDRSFKPTSYITLSEAKTVINRLTKKTARIKISPDGQVIRTTKLPKNYKDFNYILASIPNSFYEDKFAYQYTHGKQENLVDYASPKNLTKKTFKTYSNSYDMDTILAKYKNKWCKKVEDNLKYRLNVSYKTVGAKWINGLKNTYIVYNNKEMDSERVDAIKQYVKIIKDNKVTIKTSNIVVEPSTIYYSNFGYMVRCYVKFKITSAKKFYTYESKNQRLMIYGSDINLKDLKKNVWYEATFDVGLSGNSMDDDGEDFGVSTDWMYK